MIVVYSEKDPAGKLIAEQIKQAEVGIELFKVNETIIECDKEIEGIGADYLVFASKHKSETGKPCFTAHVAGNWSAAEMGGKERQLCWAVPGKMKTILMNIDHHVDRPKLGWEVFMECTHHGPFTTTPSFFVEIGSTENEWNNPIAAKIVAEAIVSHTFKPYKWPAAIGVGGGHYCPAFTRYELMGAGDKAQWAMGHVLPNYQADAVEFDVFRQGIERNSEKLEKVLIDWKGLKKAQREKILDFINRIGVSWERI